MTRSREEAEAQLRELERGAVHLVDRKELLELLMKRDRLVVKAGFDPTRPDLHLGHTVLMNKMRQFQELGHEVVFVVGDFTARIGDPSGRNVTRKVPTEAEIAEGARTYAEQAFKILDRDKTRIVYNSEWLGKMTFVDVLKLAGRYTLARMMERDDFKKRWEEHVSISIHELLYPLAQAQDSVALDCDIELGGTDQLFNLLVGRDIMRELGMRPQCVLTTPILEGTSAGLEGGKLVGDKMSKSLDNYVGVAEPPAVMFEKLMKIVDALMWRYYELLSAKTTAELAALRAECDAGKALHKDAKLALADELVGRYHGAAAATEAHAGWVSRFSADVMPDDVKTASFDAPTALPNALVAVAFATSTSDARRLIEQRAIELDGVVVTDVKQLLAPRAERYVVKRPKKRLWATILVK